MRQASLLFLLIAAVQSAPWNLSVPCYDNTGIQQTKAIPCPPPSSACCLPGWKCMSNGLCQPGPRTRSPYFDDMFYTGYCTDPTRKSADCFPGCASHTGVSKCSNGMGCCTTDQSCNCSNANLTLGLTVSVVTTLPGLTQVKDARQSDRSDPQAKSGISTGAKVGIGIGVTIAAMLLIAIGTLVVRMRYKHHRSKGCQSTSMLHSRCKAAELDVEGIRRPELNGIQTEIVEAPHDNYVFSTPTKSPSDISELSADGGIYGKF